MHEEIADNSPLHLFPPFAAALGGVLREAGRECSAVCPAVLRFELLEGYRSVARQQWLFASGRSRPGKRVTFDAVPHCHGFGLAADCVPVGANGVILWEAPPVVWERFGHCVRAAGLVWGGDWKMRDLVHIQPASQQIAIWKPRAAAHLRSFGLSVPSKS